MIGQPLRRREDLPLVRGAGRYVDDLAPPGLAHVVFVRSYHARASIVGVRAPPSAPGLLRVFTAADLTGRARPMRVTAPEGAEVADEPHPILAADEVRYAGQPVAAVVAESRAQAVDAAELVEVEYEPGEAVVDPGDAPETLMRWERSVGDVDGVLAAAAHRVQARHRIPRLVAAPIEPRGVLAAYDDAGDLLTVWASAQDPHRPLSQLAHALDRPPERIRVVIPDVGGAFGSKGVIAVEAVTVALAAMELGRPLQVDRGPGGELPGRLPGARSRGVGRARAGCRRADPGCARLDPGRPGGVPPADYRDPAAHHCDVDDRLLRHPRRGGLRARSAHRQGADRPLPRRRPARGRVPARADRRPRGARAGARAGRASPAQPDPLLPAPERAGLDVRLGRL